MSATVNRFRNALEWRTAALQSRVREVRRDGLTDYFRCRMQLGFPLPALDTMQNYQRMKFLYDCIMRFAPPNGVALEVGCYKCSSTVFIAKACAQAGIQNVYAIDLFTGTPSWGSSVDYLVEAEQKLATYGLRDRVTLIRSNSLDTLATARRGAPHRRRPRV